MASAQDETIVVEETAVVTEVPCNTRYYVTKHDNWFIQLGAGIDAPFVDGVDSKGEHHSSLTVNYNVGFGKWFSPYMGWRLAFNGGPLHWHSGEGFAKSQIRRRQPRFHVGYVQLPGWRKRKPRVLNHPVCRPRRHLHLGLPSSDVPNIYQDGHKKRNSWTLPVSAGIQARFRLCKYVDFFAEARAGFYGDNFNNVAYGRPVDINVTLNGGFTITFGGRKYHTYNPCDYLGYIDNLNNQVNDLRGALATTAAALATAEAQLPCPEVVEQEAVVVEAAPLMATVRFTLNSSRISSLEKVNVYNISEWMKANPDQNVAIVGYADADTGTSEYNMSLSRRRAQAVFDTLTNEYGINPDRLSIQAEGSSQQPYEENNWNRIVIFNVAQ